MANGAKMILKLGIDVSDLSRELGKVEKTMVRFGNQMKNVGTTLSTSITAPILGIGAASLKAFADIEKLQNGLTAIMGSSEAAAVELEKLRKVAENPGLALPQVVQASSTLQSVGMSADEARETITQFGNAVARAGGSPETFSGVTLALSQISAVGKVTQEDLNQIKERLPEFARVMKEEFGTVTAEGIRAIGVNSEEFIKRSVSALSELERAQGGLGNTFDNLKDNVNASLAELGKTINASLNLEEVFARLSEKIQMLVDKFKALTPNQQENIVKFGLIAAAIGPLLIILGQLATSISAIITVTRTLIGTLSVLTGGTYLLVAAIGALVAHYATTDEGQKSLSKTGQLLSDSFDRLKAAFQTTLDLLSKLQPLFDVLLFVLAKITVLTFEVVVAQINAVLMGINFLYDGVVKVLEGLKLIDKQKVQPKINTGFGGGSAGRPSGAGASWTEDVRTPSKKMSPILPPSLLNKPFKGAAGGGGGAASNEALTRGPAMSAVGMLPTLNLLPTALRSVAAETDRAKEATDSFTKAQDAAGKAVQYTDERIENLKKAMQELNDGIKNIIENTITDLATALGDQLGSALAGAKFSIGALIAPLADALGAFGKLAIQTGITAAGIKLALKPPINPVVAIAGGVALLALSKLVKAKLPALAQGGLAFSPTMAMVGDNRNARVDPEVIAPLSKLKAMIGDGMGGGTLETRISGNDLIILLNRSQKNLNRVQ